MLRRLWFAIVVAAACSTMLPSGTASAETILKLGLGGDPPADVMFDGMTLSTVDQISPLLGDQETNIDYQGFLSGMTDVTIPPGPPASFTLDGLKVSAPPIVIGGTLVIQDFMFGTMELYDPTDTLLLSATLDKSVLSGPIGPPGTGAVFTTTFGLVTGGTLAPLLKADSLTMSMSLTNVNGGLGFSLSGLGGPAPVLNPFVADVTLNIAALPVPEPASAVLLLVGAAALGLFAARRRAR